jgi:two-component system LytT family sensor kinase
MSVAIGVAIGLGLGVGLRLIWASAYAARRPADASAGMQSALHAATATLPHLRRGLDVTSATDALPHLRTLTGAAAIALADARAVLAIDGEGREQVRPGDLLSRLLARVPDDRMHVVGRLISSDPGCPLHAAALAPMVAGGERIGTLIAFYRAEGPPSQAELRVLAEAASLVAAQVELSVLADREERLAEARLTALRAQISPHFIYNALAAIAGNIHARPEAAREQLIDFADFTRYLFGDARPDVTLGEEIEHVRRYLRLEQARFPGALSVRIEIPSQTLDTLVPMLSLQPLVENAVRHGIRPHARHGTVSVRATAIDDHVEIRVTDDGEGIEPARIPGLLAGLPSGGIGLSNVDARLRATFGQSAGLRIESVPGRGTSVIIRVPHVRVVQAGAEFAGLLSGMAP